MADIFRRRRLAILLAVIILILGGAALIRPVLAIYNQGRAGDLLTKATQPYPTLTICEIPLVTDPGEHDQLTAAVKLLEQAVRYAPQLSQSYLLLGQTYCLLGQPEQAVDAFKTYNRLHPKNPLGRLELGFALYYLCASAEYPGRDISSTSANYEDIILCQDQTLLERIRANWQALGVDTEQFLSKARQTFDKQEYAEAVLWYQRALNYQLISSDKLSSSDQFKWAVAAIMANAPFPQLLMEQLPIFELTSPMTITADQLRFLREIPDYEISYGDLIHSTNLDEHTVGILYFGGPVGVLVDVPQDGWYQISVQAQNTPPAPVILQLEADSEPFGKIELERGDRSWEEFQFKVNLHKGVHLLDVNFLNDELVKDVDRNVIIKWLEIVKQNDS